MSMAGRTMAVVASAGVAAGMYGPVAAPAAAVGVERVTVTLQVFSDDADLAADPWGVWTREPHGGDDNPYQTWELEQVGATPEGAGVYTVESHAFRGLCLAARWRNEPVGQQECNGGKLSQRWVIDLGADHTTIESAKFRGYVLQGNGVNAHVTLVGAGPGEPPDRTWAAIRHP